ncbi:MAG: GNAT family N-acetyltransferase [Micrococcales bacterium]|nr:GNAT family N-acetyltransferase [Micrococcales bacterium]
MTAATLAERLAGTPAAVLPEGPDAVHWRPATEADVQAMLDCARAIDAADHPHYLTAREEIADDFGMAHVDPARDTLLAVDADGRVLAAGWSILPPEHDRAVSVYTTGGVRPSERGRGIGRRLIAWQRARGAEQLATVQEALPGRLQTSVDDGAPSAHRLLEREGYVLARWFRTLTRPLAEPIPDLPIAWFEVRCPTEPDEDAVRLARNAAFRDHWGSQPRTAAEWAVGWNESIARHDLGSIAVEPDGTVAAFVLAWVHPEDFPAQGYSSVYIGLVGTLAPYRGRGLAAALLARTMRLAAAEGLERAVLDVDADSPTGAVGLYERLGFTGEQRSRAYVLEV